tara:strand:+ start:77 stop:997 length:921 start_codon:yes stop_codon:yes gene_type:complete
MKIFTKVLTLVAIFISLTLSANALKLEKNDTYSGTIKDSNRNNIPLPPGEWLLTEKNITKPQGRSLGSFVEYTFYNSDVGYVFYYGPKGTKGSADMWVGRKTPSVCDGSPIAGKTKIRGINNTEWCVFDDGEYIEFRNYTAQNFSSYYHAYYIDKILLRDTSKSTIQSIGSQIFDQVRKNKAGDLSFLSNRIDLNKSSSFTSNYTSDYSSQTESKYQSLSNKEICIKATKLDGSGWMPSHSNDHVKEAWSRDLNINECRVLTGRKIAKESKNELKDKLNELKSLVDEGLITEKQYQEKSSKLLDEF